ncbi:Energy-coupling factor transporter ATP-binding protein EcfA1 [compost metagenome]
MRKVIELGRALATEPKLLLLDEPSSGLNPEETSDMAYWIEDIQKGLGITVLMVTHEPDIAAYARRMVRFVDGKVESDRLNSVKETA